MALYKPFKKTVKSYLAFSLVEIFCGVEHEPFSVLSEENLISTIGIVSAVEMSDEVIIGGDNSMAVDEGSELGCGATGMEYCC